MKNSDRLLDTANKILDIAKDKSISNAEFQRQANALMEQFFGKTKVRIPKKKVRRGIGSY
jgi:hypothetical protein